MKKTIPWVLSAAACACLSASAEIETAMSAAVLFKVYAVPGGAYALTSAADIEAWPVTWRAGETVTAAAAADGSAYTLANAATAAASAALPAQKSGVWRLVNSDEGTATVCVPWSLYGTSGTIASSGAAVFAADTLQSGPDRKTRKSEALPIAYSSDDWSGDVSKAATLKFTPPSGEANATTLERTGDGAESFTFNETGVWTVELQFADGTARTAQIKIETAGFVLIVH